MKLTDIMNETLREGKYGTFDNKAAKRVDKALDNAFKKFEANLAKAHAIFQASVKQYHHNGAKADLGQASGFTDSEGRYAIDEFATKVIQKTLGMDKLGSYATGWLYENIDEGPCECEDCNCGSVDEAEYQGRDVKLNKPTRGDTKKFKVYVNTGKKNADGSMKVKKVEFGAKGAENRIKKSDPGRRKNFRARHNCDNPGPKTKARYWSCKKW